MSDDKKPVEKKTTQKFTVLAAFTADKYYDRGSFIELTDEKQIKSLTKLKLIK